jgi:hypothetical protein
MGFRYLVRDQEVEGSTPFAPTLLVKHLHVGSSDQNALYSAVQGAGDKRIDRAKD